MRKFFLAILMLLTGGIGTVWADDADYQSNRTDFRDETIYFVIPSRFYDGDINNNVLCWDNQTNQIATKDPCWRGDFAGLIDQLDYIKALGFTAIWITPIVQNASGYDYHGYHAVDMSKVDIRLESHKGTGKYDGGSTRDVLFQDLIDAAHAKGLKIILDIVLNHTGNFGEEHLCKEFTRSRNILNQASIDNSMVPEESVLGSDYLTQTGSVQYQRRLAMMKNTDGQNHDSNNYWHHVGTQWNWDEPNRWWGQIAGDCVDLNTENPAVDDYLVSCYEKFIEMGVDGFRIDTSGHISRLSFNAGFIPQFQALGEKYKDKRLNKAPFFMYGEVCARYSEVTYRGHANLSPYFYTWKSSDEDVAEWKNYDADWWAQQVVPEGADALGNMVTCQNEADVAETSDNTFMKNGRYHTPDYSKSSGFNVIDFPLHYNFTSASNAYNLAKNGDKYYNDATYNVVYVDSHDYGPQPNDRVRFSGSDAQWAENLSLMFTFRGIPCLYYGSEIGFRRGATIDNGANGALSETGRAYYGGYITGTCNTTDFGEYTASGNVATTLSKDLSQHLMRLNKIRQAVPALRKGEWTSDDCSSANGIAFKRAYNDSYALVALNGGATFGNCPAGTYVDVVTGQSYTCTEGGSITVTAPSNQGQLRVLVKGWTGGKIGTDGPFIYDTTSKSIAKSDYDGNEEAGTDYYITPEDAVGQAGMVFSPKGDFTTETLTINISLNECSTGWYSINGGNKVTVSSNTSFTIGQGDDYGTKYTITWGATPKDGGDEVTGSLIYNKVKAYEPAIGSSSEISCFYETDASTVGIWVWNNEANFTGGDWSSKPDMLYQGVTADGRKVYKWKYQGSETSMPTGVIFLPNGSQSKDLDFVNHGYYIDGVYDHSITAEGEDPNNPDPEPTPDPEGSSDFTAYFINNAGWSKVYCYVWDATNGNKTYAGGWPGTEITGNKVDTYEGYDVYKWTYSGSLTKTPTGIIFDNGSGGNGNQTADFKFENGATYDKSGLVISGIHQPYATSNGQIIIYTLDGKRVATVNNISNAQYILREGIYIANGKKIYIR